MKYCSCGLLDSRSGDEIGAEGHRRVKSETVETVCCVFGVVGWVGGGGQWEFRD